MFCTENLQRNSGNEVEYSSTGPGVVITLLANSQSDPDNETGGHLSSRSLISTASSMALHRDGMKFPPFLAWQACLLVCSDRGHLCHSGRRQQLPKTLPHFGLTLRGADQVCPQYCEV
jgi:hypothetical protein